MKDIPYDTLKEDRQGYEILLLWEQHHRSVSEIARQLHLTPIHVQQQYSKMKVRQVHLYVQHLAFVLGHENTEQVRKVFTVAMECYQNYPCACGYLEKTYPDLLQEYRAGEPGTPRDVLEGLPPCPIHLGDKEISRIVTMREKEGASFQDIGRALQITPEKAQHTYERVYHNHVVSYVEQLQTQPQKGGVLRNIWRRLLGTRP